MDSSTTQTSSSTHPSTQYHHYVPQFLLKSFAHKYRHKKNKPNKQKIRATEPVVNCLKVDPPPAIATSMSEHGQPRHADVIENPIKRTFGQQDMYRDSTRSKPAEQQRVETMLSRLESDTSVVVRKINKAFDTGEKGITLTRSERNLVRKFLFLMKYRGPVFFERYNHETVDGYTADDRDAMVEYMMDKNLTRPLDVWLHNMRTIIELDMDTVDDLAWMMELPKKMYPGDANWAMLHIQGSFMAFVAPDKKEEDFLLTDNCYHIFEGPSNFFYSRPTGVIQKEWQNYHEFAPIAPRLMAVLRTNFLRDELVGKAKVDDENKNKNLPDSLLNDLPIKVAEMDDASLAGPRKANRFFFPFYAITTDQVDRIHAILLDNASSCSTIVFKNKASFKRTLESYMTRPDWDGKRIYAHEIDTRLSFLKTLDNVLKDQLGSTVTPVWEVVETTPTPIQIDDPVQAWRLMSMAAAKFASEFVASRVPQGLPKELPDALRTYARMGGTTQTMVADLSRAGFMVDLIVSPEKTSPGKPLTTEERQTTREKLMDAYYEESTPQLMWMFIKNCRLVISRPGRPDRPPKCAGSGSISGTGTGLVGTPFDTVDDDFFDGPEDILARHHHVFDKTKTARFNRLMYLAMKADVDIGEWPGDTLREKLYGDITKLYGDITKLLSKLDIVAFHTSIRDCGIPPVEELSRLFYDQFLAEADATPPCEQPFLSWLLGNEKTVEMVTRTVIRHQFVNMLQRHYAVDEASARELSTVFFENLFLIPPDEEGEEGDDREQDEASAVPCTEESSCRMM